MIPATKKDINRLKSSQASQSKNRVSTEHDPEIRESQYLPGERVPEDPEHEAEE